MSYTTEIVRFPDAPNNPEPVQRLYGKTTTVGEAVLKGKHRISQLALQSVPLGFRILDAEGRTVKIWQLGDDDN